jgi:hypothetical protein
MIAERAPGPAGTNNLIPFCCCARRAVHASRSAGLPLVMPQAARALYLALT